MKSLKILYLEDDPLDVELIESQLESQRFKFSLIRATTRDEFRDAATSSRFDVILVDFSIPGYDGLTALDDAGKICPDVPVIVISGRIDEETAVETLQRGATDYVLKQRLFRLAPAILRARREAKERKKRRRAEKALRESESRYRLLVDNQTDMIVKFDRQGRLTFASPSYCRTFGKPVEELLGGAFLPEVHKQDRGKVHEAVQAVQESPFRSYVQGRALTVQGWRWQAWLNTAIVSDGEDVTEIISIGRDITEQKEAEAEREQLIAQLETQNAELERFTYTVSHDLKTPLITIKGFVGLLQDDVQSGDVVAIEDDLHRINSAADTMKLLLDELLDLSRVGRVVNPPEDVPLRNLVHEALDLVERKIVLRGAAVEVDPELPSAYGDRRRLLEVLQNLIDNAVKYMGDQEDPRIQVGSTTCDGEVALFVKDNGMGIESPYQEKVFGLFEQLDSKSDGTGIGLALVKRIIEVYGGRIWVESQGQGQGSTFYFTVPLRSEAECRGGVGDDQRAASHPAR